MLTRYILSQTRCVKKIELSNLQINSSYVRHCKFSVIPPVEDTSITGLLKYNFCDEIVIRIQRDSKSYFINIVSD